MSKKSIPSLLNKENVCKIFVALVVVAAAVAVYAYRDSLPEFPFSSKVQEEGCIRRRGEGHNCYAKMNTSSADCVSNCHDYVHEIEDKFSGKNFSNLTSELSYDNDYIEVCEDVCGDRAWNEDVINGNILHREMSLVDSAGVKQGHLHIHNGDVAINFVKIG